ncbi:MAG: putative membrane protein, partial [Halobacteriales archaeon]
MNTLPRTGRRIGLRSIAIGLPLLVGATGTAAASGSDGITGTIGCWGAGTGGSWGMAGGGGWGMGSGLFGGGMFLWPLLLVGLIAVLVYALNDRGKPTNGRRSGRDTDRAMAELRERYARGELSDEEFEQRRRT